jgi:hypothetical protein
MTNNEYLANILREQNLTSAELEAVRKLREQIEGQLSVLEGSPRFYYGGSFGKKTMVKARYDLDLCSVLAPHSYLFNFRDIYSSGRRPQETLDICELENRRVGITISRWISHRRCAGQST